MCCSLRIGLCEGLKSVAETGGILLGDGKDSVAALGAARAADEVRAAALGGGGQGGIHDLDES